MMDKTLVSVIIPVYNRSRTIKRAVDSVLAQSYSNFNIILIDDCSTDNSMDIIRSFQDPRIIFLKLDQNSGAAVARNEGIKLSTSKYISFLDSDDQLEPSFLEESIATIKETSNNIGFMWTGSKLIYPKTGKILEQSWVPIKKKSTYLTFLYELRIGTGAGITVKREVFENCGYFDESLPAAEDTDFFLRIAQAYDYTYSKKILINIYRDDNDRLSTNLKKVAIAYNQFLPKHFSEIEKIKDLKRKYFYKMMWLNYRLEDQITARHYYKKIPKELRSYKIKFIKYLYEYLPLKNASNLHQKLSS